MAYENETKYRIGIAEAIRFWDGVADHPNKYPPGHYEFYMIEQAYLPSYYPIRVRRQQRARFPVSVVNTLARWNERGLGQRMYTQYFSTMKLATEEDKPGKNLEIEGLISEETYYMTLDLFPCLKLEKMRLMYRAPESGTHWSFDLFLNETKDFIDFALAEGETETTDDPENIPDFDLNPIKIPDCMFQSFSSRELASFHHRKAMNLWKP